MNKTLTFDFCKMSIYDNYVVVVINEGVNLTPNHNSVLVEVTENHFSEKPFVYITHRINSYSVDPKVFEETSKIKNLVAFAVVSQSDVRIANASFEKQFLSKPHKSFTKLIDAIAWCEQLVEVSKNKF